MSIIEFGDTTPAAKPGEVMSLLGKLARKGAYLEPSQDAAGACCGFALYSPANSMERPLMAAAPGLVTEALRAGWLERDGEAGRVTITRKGAQALKAVRSAGSGAGTGALPLAKRCRAQAATPCGPRGRHNNQPCQGNGNAVPVINDAESPLGWLRRRKGRDGLPLIDDAQFFAGERLRADFWHAQMTPRVTANWSSEPSASGASRGSPGLGVELRDSVVAAQERVQAALRAVGPELAGVLIDVCCHLNGLEVAERNAGWPQRAGKVVLLLALSALARHYRPVRDETGRDAGRRRAEGGLRHWAVDDYRPRIE